MVRDSSAALYGYFIYVILNQTIYCQKGCEHMALAREKIYTIEDIYSLPEGQRAELIDGTMYMMAPPKRIHQEIVMELSAVIHAYIRNKRGECKVYPAPFAVFLNMDDKTYVEPDISVICDKGKLTDDGCMGAPDWVIEVVSPSSRRMDYILKLFQYRSVGVREYWIVDPDKNRVMVYNFETETGGEYTMWEAVTSGIYDDLEIDFRLIQERK